MRTEAEIREKIEQLKVEAADAEELEHAFREIPGTRVGRVWGKIRVLEWALGSD